jgi:hypothetical protein
MKIFLRTAASIVLLIIAFTATADWTSVQKQFKAEKDHDKAVSQLKESEVSKDDDLAQKIDSYDTDSVKKKKEDYDAIANLLDAKVTAEHFKSKGGADQIAKEIKKDPIYSAEKEAGKSNWIEKLNDRLKKIFERKPKSPDTPDMPQLPGWVGPIIQALFVILCAAIIALIIYLLVKVPWAWTAAGRAKRAKRGGILKDGELLLSEDEYLIEADRLIAEGKFREACRALYLASLLRISAARIARFEPTQTNWEHLRRIEFSKTKPENLEFRSITKAFDLAWYGYRATQLSDVLPFRESYVSIKAMTEGMG